MKRLSKKKYPELEDAVSHIAKRQGIKESNVKLVVNHRRFWGFALNGVGTSNGRKKWSEFLAQYKADNPDTPHKEALANASEIYQAQKTS